MSGKLVLNVAKNLLFLIAGIAMLFLAFRGKDLQELIADIRQAKISWIVFSMILGFAAFVSRAIRWKILLEPMGYKPKVTSSVYSIIIGYLANLAIPRIGELTRCTVMSKTEDIPVDKLFGTVILERVIDLLILVFLTVLVVLLKVETFGNFFMNLIRDNAASYPKIALLLGIACVGFVLLLISLYILRARFTLHPWSIKIRSFFLGLKEGLVSVKNIKNMKGFVFHTFLIWFFYYVMTWIVFYAFEETSGLSMVDGLFILVVGGFGMAAPVQGGIGAYHLIVSMGMGVLGIDQTIGLSFATVLHTSQTFLVLALGVLSLILVYLQNRNNASNQLIT
ncbi:MAG TPA: hypothetical protein DCX54_10915 [Flavobacteriales bacterium]|nr:hypothetical protein [Flavobacteriales bacterium]